MLVSKWGDSLAVRLSEDDIARLGLKEGDEVVVEVRRAESEFPEQLEDLTPEQWLVRMRELRGRIPADFEFDREEANAR
jgi:antitoxin MazE